MHSVNEIGKNLVYSNDGFWKSKNVTDVSYPEYGHELCLTLEDDSFWFNHRNDIIIELVKQYNNNNVVIDIGGGNGFVSNALQNNGIECVLVEPGINGIVNAKKRGVRNLVCSTLEDAGFEENSLDSVGLFDVLEHIENDNNFIYNLSGYLKNDGLIFLTVPAYNFLWSDEDKKGGHFRRYTLAQLKNVLNTSNFEILFMSYFFKFLPLPIFLLRTIPSFFKISKLLDVDKEHKNEDSIFSRIIKKTLENELKTIKNKKRINFGGSCVVVGKRVG